MSCQAANKGYGKSKQCCFFISMSCQHESPPGRDDVLFNIIIIFFSIGRGTLASLFLHDIMYAVMRFISKTPLARFYNEAARSIK